MAFYGRCMGCGGHGHNINMCKNQYIVTRRKYFSNTIENISKKEDIYKYLKCLTVENLRLVGSMNNINCFIPETILLVELSESHYHKNRKRRVDELNNVFNTIQGIEHTHIINFENRNKKEIASSIKENILRSYITGKINEEELIVQSFRIIRVCYDILSKSTRYIEFMDIIEEIITDICSLFVNSNSIIEGIDIESTVKNIRDRIKQKKYFNISSVLLYSYDDNVYNPMHEITENINKSCCNNNECPICLTGNIKSECIMTSCGHKYCETCFSTLVENCEIANVPKCALCRGKIDNVYIYNTDIYNKYMNRYSV